MWYDSLKDFAQRRARSSFLKLIPTNGEGGASCTVIIQLQLRLLASGNLINKIQKYKHYNDDIKKNAVKIQIINFIVFF